MVIGRNKISNEQYDKYLKDAGFQKESNDSVSFICGAARVKLDDKTASELYSSLVCDVKTGTQLSAAQIAQIESEKTRLR